MISPLNNESYRREHVRYLLIYVMTNSLHPIVSLYMKELALLTLHGAWHVTRTVESRFIPAPAIQPIL